MTVVGSGSGVGVAVAVDVAVGVMVVVGVAVIVAVIVGVAVRVGVVAGVGVVVGSPTAANGAGACWLAAIDTPKNRLKLTIRKTGANLFIRFRPLGGVEGSQGLFGQDVR